MTFQEHIDKIIDHRQIPVIWNDNDYATVGRFRVPAGLYIPIDLSSHFDLVVHAPRCGIRYTDLAAAPRHSIVIPRDRSSITPYLVSLHELGHFHHGHTLRMFEEEGLNGILRSECEAWLWALDNVRFPIPENRICNQVAVTLFSYDRTRSFDRETGIGNKLAKQLGELSFHTLIERGKNLASKS